MSGSPPASGSTLAHAPQPTSILDSLAADPGLERLILTEEISAPASQGLVRAIGRWTLVAAIINAVIGSGIFGLPSALAGFAGEWSPVTVIVAGAGILVIVFCFAEVGSRFDAGGGPYLYSRSAFGPAVGFQVGWMHIFTRLLSAAAVVNVLVAYLTKLAPWVGTPTGRTFTIVAAVIVVTIINVGGVKQAAWTVNLFTIAKVLPLVAVILLGVFQLRSTVFATQAVAEPRWSDAVLLLVFAYGGFESAIIAAGETKDPKRDTAFALLIAMSAITIIYSLVQLVVVGVLPNAAASTAPFADTMSALVGPVGSTIAIIAVAISVFGWLMGFALMTPRILFAMAERGEIPAFCARVHPQFRTPYVAIVVNSAIALALSLAGSFTQLATSSAITRLTIYFVCCASLLALRRRWGPPEGFRIVAAPMVATVAMLLCLWLLSTRSLAQSWFLLVIIGSGAVAWLLAGRNRSLSD
jgi:basic amino acid/polyamine antiporter, APA family